MTFQDMTHELFDLKMGNTLPLFNYFQNRENCAQNYISKERNLFIKQFR